MKHLEQGWRQMVSAIRNAAAEAIVTLLNDSGGAQLLNLTTATGAQRADVEVMWPWGFSALPPVDGMITLVFAVGGDPANLRALPPSNPSARFGNLAVGEAVLYGADGSRVHVRDGGIVDIWGGAQVNVHTKSCTINAPNGCVVNGNVTVEGNLTASGDVSDSHGSLNRLREHYNEHSHAANGAPPTPQDPE
jgi:phage gp45-like